MSSFPPVSPRPGPRSFSRRHIAFLIGLAALLVILGVHYSSKAQQNRSAFNRWREQILHLDTENIADKYNYPNPPIMAVLLEPLVRLPPLAGAIVWFYLKAAMAMVSLYWVLRLVEGEGPPFPPRAKALVVLCSLKPVIDDLNHGNVNLFILFLVVAFLTAYRTRRDLLAGLLLALAVACKITPALFIPYLVWKRAWRTLAGVAVGLVLFFYPGVVPGLRLGMERNQEQLASWYQGMVKPFVIEGKVTSEHVNQSLPGLIYRLGTHSPSFVVFTDNIETPSRYDNLVSLSGVQAKIAVKTCMALWVLLFVWCCRTPADQRDGVSAAAEMGIVMLGMLLFSERTWKHHCVTLMLPFAVLCHHLAAGRLRPPWRASLIAVLALSVALITLTGLGPARDRGTAGISPGFAKMALVYGAYTVTCLVLLGSLAVVLRRSRGAQGELRSAGPTASPVERAA